MSEAVTVPSHSLMTDDDDFNSPKNRFENKKHQTSQSERAGTPTKLNSDL